MVGKADSDSGRAGPAGLSCPRCGSLTLRAAEHQIEARAAAVQLCCGRCAAPVRLLTEYDYRAAGPVQNPADQEPSVGGAWIGLVRKLDGGWEPIATAPTLARLWDVLSYYPWALDRLCVPAAVK